MTFAGSDHKPTLPPLEETAIKLSSERHYIEFELEETILIQQIELPIKQDLTISVAYRPGQWKEIGVLRDSKHALHHPLVARYIGITSSYSISASEIRVMIKKDAHLTARFKTKWRLNPSFLANHEITVGKLTNIRVTYVGRLGNYVTQIINAIIFSRRCGFSDIELFDLASIRIPDSLSFESVNIRRYDPDDRLGPGSLAGPFLRAAQYGQILHNTIGEDAAHIAQKLIKPLLIPSPKVRLFDKSNSVTVHLRAGDVFCTNMKGHGQPPLAFYLNAINNVIMEYHIENVIVVYEDDSSPIYKPLIDWIISNKLGLAQQSGTEREDLDVIVNSRHLVVGFSGFIHAACLLSSEILSVSYFRDQHQFSIPFEKIPAIKKIYRYDGEGYPLPNEWRNLPEQQEIMLNYPTGSITRSF